MYYLNKTHFSTNKRAKRVVRQHLRFTEELHLSITKHVHKLYLKSLLIYGFLYSVKKKSS